MSDDSGIGKYVRRHLAGLVGYSASTSPETLKGKVEVPVEDIIKLDANENPYGCSPIVCQALATCSDFNIYPDAGQEVLRKQLAKYTSAADESIVASCGSNLLLDYVIRLFVEPGEEVIDCIPTFDLYRFSTAICSGSMVTVERDENYAVDVNKLKAAISNKTKLIFLANPNSPTGNITPQGDIIEILDTGLPVVIDEAYYEFSGETVVPLVSLYSNLMVLRTFSKWAGLAGLRVGYGIFPPIIADYLHTTTIPYNVSMAALIAVRESLADIDYLMDRVRTIIAERERFFAELMKLSWLKPYPSKANFIFCRILRGDAKELKQKLLNRGILVRYFDKPLLRNAIRFSVGKTEHTDRLIKALRDLGGK
ncbi:histidinol-phosphate transaminase [Chloroflexota bacterium]